VFRGQVNLPGEQFDRVRLAMELPQPRVALGLALRGIASAAIDLSDGLLGDLRHVLRRSGAAFHAGGEAGTSGDGPQALGAWLQDEALPRSPILNHQPAAMQRECLLFGGDDYELLFTAASAQRVAVERAAQGAGVAVARIGQIVQTPGVQLLDAQSRPIALQGQAFDHFKT